MPKPALNWLPERKDWGARLARLEQTGDAEWDELVWLAGARLNFLQTERLGRFLQDKAAAPAGLATKPVRLAILGSSTVEHLLASIRVAGLRRGLWISTYTPGYGQHVQEFLDPASGLHRFAPTHVLFAFDADYLTLRARGREAASGGAVQALLSEISQGWRQARSAFGCTVLHQTALARLPPLLGGHEHRLPGSPAQLIADLNYALRSAADAEDVYLVALDRRAEQDGVREWFDPVLWGRAKQEITPVAAPVYGDLVARVLAAHQGRSAKCLVLDLDNTIWGGVIGDDGMDGVVLGQGSAEGEAFIAVQRFAADLAARGVLLAVCSKNDPETARQAFSTHPEMHLKLGQISAFVANWDDKAGNLRQIAKTLNIGLDSLVFVDDNPFERELVREIVPEVRVPEIPDDEPALIPDMLSDAGYFDAVSITDEDIRRVAQYAANAERENLRSAATDLTSYLRELDMRLTWSRFDKAGLSRIVQLINKTNQFNLRTQRYTAEEVRAVIGDPNTFGLQFRLSDKLGDNGMISVVIGRVEETSCLIDTWLMSCRVLGRGVEQAILNVVVSQAKRAGVDRLIGEYVPTEKNGIVADLYDRLGFRKCGGEAGGRITYELRLPEYVPFEASLIELEPVCD